MQMINLTKSLFFPAILHTLRPIVSATQDTMDPSLLITYAKDSIPPLDGTSHKGQAGRIGVVGGSLEYTGAPYFAGISAMKVGADLTHIFCQQSAAPVIKSYSPELIVHPLLDVPNPLRNIEPWLDRLHVLVIGPGLGRDDKIFETVSQLIHICRSKRIPLVIDADGLFLITNNIDLIKNYPSPGVILTPNIIEYQRLINVIGKVGNDTIDFSKLGENVTILKKGKTDEIFNQDTAITWKSSLNGSGRRCGGQGDLLSGSIAVFLYWALQAGKLEKSMPSSVATYAASRMIRLCNEKAFHIKGRSMLASDMIEYIHESFEELFAK